MLHLKKFSDLFESAPSLDFFPDNFKEVFKGDLINIKTDLKYALARGLRGHFGTTLKNGKIYPVFYFDGSDIPLIFNSFYAENGKLAPEKNLDVSLDEDLESVNKFLSSIGKSPLPRVLFNSEFNGYYSGIGPNKSRLNGSNYIGSMIGLVLGDYKEFLKSEKDQGDEVSIEAIKKLPVFKDLLGIGAGDATSERIWQNGNFKITHPILSNKDSWTGNDIQDAITIYSGGPVRITSSGRPAIMSGAPGDIVVNMKDWDSKLDFVLKYLLRKIAKEYFGVSGNNELKKLSSGTVGDFFNSVINDYSPEKFFDWISNQSQSVQDYILDSGVDLKDFIEKYPAKAAIAMKRVYNNPAIKKQLGNLDSESSQEFLQNLGLVGNLNDLGF